MIISKCSNIVKRFPVQRGVMKETVGYVSALDGVSVAIERGSSFGLVGESGSGKTTLGKVLLGILKPDSGTVRSPVSKMQAVFQDPHNSLDPTMRVFDIVAEGLVISGDRKNLKERVLEAAETVRLDPSSLVKYPHQFSGGERQKISIARAIVTGPEFIVLDEPVSSLDVTIQLQILKLLKEIKSKRPITYLFISHDLRAVKFLCDRVAVMKDGRIIEEGPLAQIYSNPSHPYTRLLLLSTI